MGTFGMQRCAQLSFTTLVVELIFCVVYLVAPHWGVVEYETLTYADINNLLTTTPKPRVEGGFVSQRRWRTVPPSPEAPDADLILDIMILRIANSTGLRLHYGIWQGCIAVEPSGTGLCQNAILDMAPSWLVSVQLFISLATVSLLVQLVLTGLAAHHRSFEANELMCKVCMYSSFFSMFFMFLTIAIFHGTHKFPLSLLKISASPRANDSLSWAFYLALISFLIMPITTIVMIFEWGGSKRATPPMPSFDDDRKAYSKV